MTSIGRTVPQAIPAQSADGVVASKRGSKMRDESLPHRHDRTHGKKETADSKLADSKLSEDAPRIVGPASNLKEAGARSKLPAAKLREDAPRIIAPASKLEDEAARGKLPVAELGEDVPDTIGPASKLDDDAAGDKLPASELSDREILDAVRALNGEQGTIVDKTV